MINNKYTGLSERQVQYQILRMRKQQTALRNRYHETQRRIEKDRASLKKIEDRNTELDIRINVLNESIGFKYNLEPGRKKSGKDID